MRGISVLGSTGSIGTQTLDVIRRNKDIKVVALAAGTRVKELAEQVREFRPSLVCIGTEKLAGELKLLLSDIDVKIVYGDEGLIEAATHKEADIVLTAVVKLRFREKSRFKSCGLLVKITCYSNKRKRFKRIY